MQINKINFLKFSESENLIEDGIINKAYGPRNIWRLFFVQECQKIF